MKPWIKPLTLAALVTLAACTEKTEDAKPAGSAAPASRPADRGAVDASRGTAAGESAPSGPSAAAVRETGTTRAAVTLMTTPHSDAKPAGQLAANTAVSILERRGGWLRLAAEGTSGWAKLHQVRVGEGPQAGRSDDGLAMLKNIGETGRSGSTGIVATTGIRGLSAEALTSAKPDPAAVKAIEAWRVNASQAREFANAAKLKAASVPYLPKPE